jgi:menaquinone-9 beta-reductase
MPEVVVVGAGPAGAVAAAVLARAGRRVQLIDRASFPRDKLCGDTINPGTLVLLRRLGLSAAIESRGLPLDGMRLTGSGGASVEGRYPRELCGRALLRRDVDSALVAGAVAAGADFTPELPVVRAIVEDRAGTRLLRGVIVRTRQGSEREIRAPVTIAADGRRSTIAFQLGLARHPADPRRWAIGAYFEGFGAGSSLGEMHVRPGRYIGVAPLPGGMTNVCLVRSWQRGDGGLREPSGTLLRALASEPMLRDRAEGARLAGPPNVLGPLAVDVRHEPVDGLVLAGDASGFIDPMTGDGLRFAVRGGELAAAAALEALDLGWSAAVHAHLLTRRRQEFGAKWRFNRGVRRLVASPRAIAAAAFGARLAPRLVRAMIVFAGDCGLTSAAVCER